MRSHPTPYRLMFLLPDGAAAPSGFHQPSPEGCTLNIKWPMAEISGPSRKAVFDHASRLLRLSCRHLPPLAIASLLSTPARPAGRDSWSIIVGADVAFSPTGLEPEFPSEAPPLRLHVGGRGA